MRYKGKVTNWNADRAFGFITPAGGGERVFLHITAVSDRRRPPLDGDMVTYDLAYDERKRPRAVSVKMSTPIRPKSQGTSAPQLSSVPLVAASLFMLFIVAATAVGPLPLPVIAGYGVLSVVTFVAYWFDKSAARHGLWRTKESSLLLLGLAGGWPGAVLAQSVLRHKSRKDSFQVPFWGTVVMNCVALGWLLTDSGTKFLEHLSN
ncbi:MAG: DUF1294 domain-containing protein [Steroidobacteraceae bacterium]